MELTKQAQNFDGESVSADELLPNEMFTSQKRPLYDELNLDSLDDSLYDSVDNSVDDLLVEDNDNDTLLEVTDEPQVFTFTLPFVPGGLDQEELEDPAELEVEEDNDIEISDDPWSWSVSTFLSWLCDKMQKIPPHSGRDTVGLERAISYLEAIDREISKAVRADINGELDVSKVEEARDELYHGLERLIERYEKINSNKNPRKRRKKKAELQSGMVKEAQKATHVGGIIVTVPLLISSIARTCLNSMVSAGKDIEDVFDKLAKKYELTSREEMETMQLLADMGYPMRRARGYHRDEEVDYTSTDNFDWSANYPA